MIYVTDIGCLVRYNSFQIDKADVLNMNKTMSQTLFNNWHPMRWVALFVGVLLFGMGAWHADIISVLLGSFFLFQAATNTGCLCGNCAVPARATESDSNDIDDVEFTEIKED